MVLMKINVNVSVFLISVCSDLNLPFMKKYVQHLVDFGVPNAFGKPLAVLACFSLRYLKAAVYQI